jgi:hypothetical protein
MASIKTFDGFIQQLEKVAELGREVAELKDLIGKHEANALAQVLDKLKPIMQWIDQPITTREEWVASDNPRDRQTFYYKEPGIVLVNNFESTVRDAHGRMNYSGYKIAFTRSGKLVQLDRRGSFSEGATTNYWSSDAHELDITPEFAARHLPEVLRSVVNAIERAVATQRAKRDELQQRLKVLKEVARMLEAGPVAGTEPAPPASAG